MKRVLAKTKWSEPKPHKPQSVNPRIKDHWGTPGKPPYYDPFEDHIHLWKSGYLISDLRFMENPFSETRGKAKIQHHQLLARFCAICHKPQTSLDQVLITSDGKISKDEASEMIIKVLENKVERTHLTPPPLSPMPQPSHGKYPIIRWTLDEEDKLSDLHAEYGNNWKMIETFFQLRSALSLERHWYSMNKPRPSDVPWLRDDPDSILNNYYRLKKK